MNQNELIQSRDIEIVRAILEWAEKGGIITEKPEGITDARLGYHGEIMKQAGLITGSFSFTRIAGAVEWRGTCVPSTITWHGHEYLAALRDKELGPRLRNALSNQLLPMGREILISIVKSHLAAKFDIQL
jgi:hypothetical protein